MKAWFAWYDANPVLDKKGVKEPFPINAKDREGLTALHYAARFNKFKILQHLLTEKPGMLSSDCHVILGYLSDSY